MTRALVIVMTVLVASAGVARAQGDDVPALIALVKSQPSGMDRNDWKEKRRDAAKRLGELKDKRAVPVLEDVAQTETFDIIGEIAIDALGQIGDASAVPTLQKIASDPSRDDETRDKAKKALGKLGAKPASGDGGGSSTTSTTTTEPTTITHTTTSTPVTTTTASTATVGALPGDEENNENNPAGPTWDDDVLAASERLTFAIGSATLSYDTVQDRLDVDFDGASTYQRTMDRRRSSYVYGGDAHVIAATQDPTGRAVSRQLVITAEGGGEYRAYTSAGVYAIGFGQVRLEGTRLTTRDATDPTQDNNDRWLALDGQVAVGGGWGRVLDVGTRMRVARIASALEASRQLGRPIDDDVARKLQAAWWAARSALGSHRRLTATVAILRDAGILLGEPDAGTTYELLQILDDPGFASRPSGHDVQLAFSEGYLKRWRWPGDEATPVPNGRLEQLLVRARVGRQMTATRDVGGEAYARLRLFAPMGTPAPWAVGVTARARQWVYGEHYDPTGALDLSADLAVSSDDNPNTDLGIRIGGEIGWTVILSRASQIRVAGNAAIDAGELFVGLNVQASYGLLDGTFAASVP